jgi:hypothetical protein
MKIKLNNVRLSFPDLFTATQFGGTGPFSYGAAFLFAPDSATDKAVKAAFNAVAKEKWGAKADAIIKAVQGNPQKCCYYDGNLKDYDGYENNMVLSAKRPQDKGRPLVVDADKSPLQAEDGKPYAGCYVNATVELWPQDNQHGKGMRCTVLGVQFLRDGDRFGGGSQPDTDDFEDISVTDTADDLA